MPAVNAFIAEYGIKGGITIWELLIGLLIGIVIIFILSKLP